ncbi:ferroxidase HEPHL1 isoform X2 [Protopterus annectens]|uniref:ferroxidase HEPHL1 isoform X2 n=1 Tax=Protopterus annectens TaxID=7888 RepID=UPI001CF9B442|nr:ferroxidase HEPHL1 isoform X2 [Protopterus annectens]
MSCNRSYNIAFLCFLFLLVISEECTIRTFYIGIMEEFWDYAPSGRNLITGLHVEDDPKASVFLRRGPDRIGSIYKKAIYKQFTDGSYTQEVPKPDWLGFLGPIIMAETEDTIVVHLKNFACHNYSLHPHGVLYLKDSEGALYPDGTSGKDKADDAVPPGGTHTFTWIVKQSYAPTSDDPNCLTWAYHSHLDAPKDIASGLVGVLLTCKKGVLSGGTPNRIDVDLEFIMLFSVMDENASWYIDENIQTFCSAPDTVIKNDADFIESNNMHSINGYMYGNMPHPNMCVGNNVSWHLVGIGRVKDLHSVYFYGQTVTVRGHRLDAINLLPATFVTAEMKAINPGKWLLSCQVNDHTQAGMQVFYNVDTCHQQPAEVPLTGKTRKYFIAAEPLIWDYGPLGIDNFNKKPLNATGTDSQIYFVRGPQRIGGKYWKDHYVEYTDETFTKKKTRSSLEAHLGILGPVIKSEVGDRLLVTFMNKGNQNYSIHPHGVLYSKAFEGAAYIDGSQKLGSHVAPGCSFTYNWTVPESVGPTSSDPDCLTYLYFSAVDPVKDTNTGLVGPLIVCKKNALSNAGDQIGVNQAFYLMFTIFDENLSWYLDKNIQTFTTDPINVIKEDSDFQESNKMHAVNGYMYGNQPGLELCKGKKVSWHLFGLGTEVDLHGINFEGNSIYTNGLTRDTVGLFPHTSLTIMMKPDNVGTFKLVCRVFNHFTGGMKQLFYVKNCIDKTTAKPNTYRTRTFYLAAEEVEWDYSPSHYWVMEKNTTENQSYFDFYVGKGPFQIGSKYKKVIYQEYTDVSFTIKKLRTPNEEHLGILGPMIHAEVGDYINIVFKNSASRNYSIHPHGVEEVRSDGQPDTPNTEPGKVRTYLWKVPERSGPGKNDPNCIPWAYYSTASFVKDLNSGLVGTLLTCRKGTLKADGLRKDVNKEFAVLFMIFDENKSWYLEENVKNYLNKNFSDALLTNTFIDSNKMHGMNGKVYGNLRGLNMVVGETIAWYLLGLGDEVDLHTAHFHGETFIFKTDKSHRGDVYDLIPGIFETVEMIAENPGTWIFHCHVDEHVLAGMETTFTIFNKTAPAAT